MGGQCIIIHLRMETHSRIVGARRSPRKPTLKKGFGNGSFAWLAGNEDPVTGGWWNTDSPWHDIAKQLLKFSLVVNLGWVPAKGDPLAGPIIPLRGTRERATERTIKMGDGCREPLNP